MRYPTAEGRGREQKRSESSACSTPPGAPRTVTQCTQAVQRALWDVGKMWVEWRVQKKLHFKVEEFSTVGFGKVLHWEDWHELLIFKFRLSTVFLCTKPRKKPTMRKAIWECILGIYMTGSVRLLPEYNLVWPKKHLGEHSLGQLFCDSAQHSGGWSLPALLETWQGDQVVCVARFLLHDIN